MSTLSIQTVDTIDAAPRQSAHLRVLPRPVVARKLRLMHGVVALAGLALILLVQLGISLLLSDGAYRLTALQTESAELARSEQSLSEQLVVRSSPQDVGLAAQELGMVQGQASQFIELSSGSVIGGPDALHLDSSVTGAGGLNVPNELVTRDDAAVQAAVEAGIAAASAADADTDTEPYPGMVLPAAGESGE